MKLVGAAAFLSWLGLFIHNLADLPGQTLLSAETALPGLVYLVVGAAWITWPAGRRVVAWILFAMGLLNLVGGGLLSVLPLQFLPFAPEQSLYHYAFHVLYGALQVPLLITTTRYLRKR